MAGDIANPRIWFNADCYVAPVGSGEPTNVTTAWTAADPDWTALGLLGEDAGLVEAREIESTDHWAWGSILVRTTRSKQKRTLKVVALENTPAVWNLVNPGSVDVTNLGITTRTVYVPTTNPMAFGFEFVDGLTIMRRVIPTAEVTEVGDITFSDSEMAAYELTISVYPDGDGILYKDITNDAQAFIAS